MAWLGRKKKEDDHKTYGRTGNSDHVHHPVILDSDGRKHPIGGYTATATHNSQRFVAKTEQVVRFQNIPGFMAMRDQKYSPPRKEVYKDHRDGDKPHPVPRMWSSQDRPEKTSEFSPKARDEVVHGQGKNPPWNNGYRDNSPPSNDQYYRTNHHDYGKNNNFNSKTNNKYHDDDDEDEEEDDVICNDDGVCFKNPRIGSKPNYNENEKRKGNGYNPPTYTVPISTQQPKRDTYYKAPHVNTAINNNNSDQKEKGNGYSPRKGYQEIIDSAEARRRYGGPTKQGAGTGSGYDEEKYTRTIDSVEAQRKYGGVLLPN